MKTEVVRAISDVTSRVRVMPVGKTPVSRRCVSGRSRDRSSFAYKECRVDSLFVYGGRVQQSGKGFKTVQEDGVENKVLISGGSKDVPGYVSLRMTLAVGPSSVMLVFTLTEPVDDTTYLFRILHEAYLNSAGNAVWKKSRLSDWNIGAIL